MTCFNVQLIQLTDTKRKKSNCPTKLEERNAKRISRLGKGKESLKTYFSQTNQIQVDVS